MTVEAGEGAQEALDLAARVGEIGFAEFTSDLISNIFGALTNANAQQTAQYIDLVNTVSGSLADFIEQTEEAVTPEQIKAFLEAVGIDFTAPISAADADTINDAVELPPPNGAGAAEDNRVATAGDSNAIRNSISEAVAKRIAANRYDFLQQMVRMGVVRVIVDNGLIETRLIFRTAGKTERYHRFSERQRNQIVAGGGGGFAGGAGVFFGTGIFGSGGGVGGYGAWNSLRVRTASKYNRDVTGSRVQIYGRVKVNFKTDYQPLDTSADDDS